MDPTYIYFKEINIDQDKTFTANFSKENKIEKVVFNKENEYGVTGLQIKAVLPDEKILKIDNKKEQQKISREIQELVKQNKEPNLTFIISNPETKSLEIPFVKKNKTELQRKKLTFFNTDTKKNEDFTFYDYVRHLEKFGYEWSKESFKHEIKIKNNKIIKKLTLEKNKRILLQNDEFRRFNMLNNWRTDIAFNSNLISFSVAYLEDTIFVKNFFKITDRSQDFTTLMPLRKTFMLVNMLKDKIKIYQ